jgi:hypothetical protein
MENRTFIPKFAKSLGCMSPQSFDRDSPLTDTRISVRFRLAEISPAFSRALMVRRFDLSDESGLKQAQSEDHGQSPHCDAVGGGWMP